MKRIKLINRIFYCIFLLGFLLFMASGFIFSTVDEVTPADKRTSVVVKPEDTRYIGDDTIEYYVKIICKQASGSRSICRWKTYILYKSA